MDTPVVVVAGGVDPGGGAGLGMDVAFLGRLGVRTAPVVTALTVQNDRGVSRVEAVPASLFQEQLTAALDSLGVAVKVIKTGLVVSAEQADVLARHAGARRIPLVVDPVLGSGTGHRFVAGDPVAVLAALLAAATLLTPNAGEASTLSGQVWSGARESLLRLARSLAGPRRTVAVTGGDVSGEVVSAGIAGPAGEQIVDAPRVGGGPFHGTGCAFASAAAGYMALGLPPADAAAAAHRLVAAALASARGIADVRTSPEPWAV